MSQNATIEDVKKIAGLSRLNLADDKLPQITDNFNKILDFVQQIQEVDTNGIETLDHVFELQNITRKDEPLASLNLEKTKAMAPKFEAGFFVVPQVIDTD